MMHGNNRNKFSSLTISFGPGFYWWLRMVSASEEKTLISNVLSHWLSPCSVIDRKRSLGVIFFFLRYPFMNLKWLNIGLNTVGLWLINCSWHLCHTIVFRLYSADIILYILQCISFGNRYIYIMYQDIIIWCKPFFMTLQIFITIYYCAIRNNYLKYKSNCNLLCNIYFCSQDSRLKWRSGHET